MNEMEIAEKAVRDVAASFGLVVPPGQLQAVASVFVGLVAIATGSAVKRAEEAGRAAASHIQTAADAAEELGK